MLVFTKQLRKGSSLISVDESMKQRLRRAISPRYNTAPLAELFVGLVRPKY